MPTKRRPSQGPPSEGRRRTSILCARSVVEAPPHFATDIRRIAPEETNGIHSQFSGPRQSVNARRGHNPYLDEDTHPLALSEKEISDVVALLATLTSCQYLKQGVQGSTCLVSRCAGERVEIVSSNRASATKVASLSTTSANPATIRICISHCRFEKVASKDSSGDLSVLDVSCFLLPRLFFNVCQCGQSAILHKSYHPLLRQV
jgi:hypothetical protein